MSHAIPLVLAAIVASSSLLVLAQAGGANAGSAGAGTGTGASSANAGPSAPAGMGTRAGSAGPSAPPGMGTKDTATGANLGTNGQPRNPNVQPATPAKSRAAVQAARNAGVGHAQNGLPIGALGTGTSNEDQLIIGPSSTRNTSAPAAQAKANISVGHATNGLPVGTFGKGTSLSDEVNRPRAARAGDKVLDAQARVERRTTVSSKRIPGRVKLGL
ncbi:hypothetical protein IVB18_37995 [Bradyrhizobium sp. 186]|nr:hypothetical protein IVB18_37995 [Bradyrhizobium sp. 186]